MEVEKWLKESLGNASPESLKNLQVHVAHRYFEKSPTRYAQKLFDHYGLSEHPKKNGSLLYVNLRKKTYTWIFGPGFQSAVGQTYIDELHQVMKDDFLSTHHENAIRLSILTVAETLKKINSLDP
jgi:hypothetical protein